MRVADPGKMFVCCLVSGKSVSEAHSMGEEMRRGRKRKQNQKRGNK